MFCWVFGRGCSGNNEAKEAEALRTYTSAVNKLIQRSSGVAAQFDGMRHGIADLTKEDANRKLTQMANDCKQIAKDAGKLNVAKKAVNLQPLAQLSFDLRAEGVDQFRQGVADVFDKKSADTAAAVMSQGLMDLVVSDEALARFRAGLEAKLKASKMTFEKVADSTFIPVKDDALLAGVTQYIDSFSGEEAGDALHGVAISGLSTTPASVDQTESGVSILPYSDTFTVKVSVQNQGNQQEKDIPVSATLTQEEGGTPQKKTAKITRLKPDETGTVVIEGLKPVTGSDKTNVLTVTAGPVPKEEKTDNNEDELTFIMQAEGQ